MTKYRNSNAPASTSTYNRDNIDSPQKIFMRLCPYYKRSNQINSDIRKELHEKLDEFATHNDSLEEIFENKEQIEVSNSTSVCQSHMQLLFIWLNIAPQKHEDNNA